MICGLRNNSGDLETIGAEINVLAQTTNGDIWAGTHAATSEGLYRYIPKDGSITKYTEKHGLLRSVIHYLLAGKDGELWIALPVV